MQRGGYHSPATTCHLLILEVDAFPTAPSSGLLPAMAGCGSGATLFFSGCQKPSERAVLQMGHETDTTTPEEGEPQRLVCQEVYEPIDSSDLVSFHVSFGITKTHISCSSVTPYQSQPSYDSFRAPLGSQDDLFPVSSQ